MNATRRRLAARLRHASPERVLSAVRIAGTGVVAALGQLVVDMPTGYFGAVEQSTVVGAIYAAAMLAVMGVCSFGALVGFRPARWAFPPLLLMGVAFFLPALATDVAVAGPIVGWQLATLSRVVFSDTSPPRRLVRPAGVSAFRPAIVHLLALSIFSTVLVAGFELTELFAGRIACLALDAIAIVAAFVVLRGDRALARWTVASMGAVAIAIVLGGGLVPVLAALGVVQVGLLAIALAEGPLAAEVVRQFVERPALLVLTTFAAVAILGAIALSFPAAAENGRIPPLDALFTSVSATCVTGLVTVDTPNAYSTFGEAVVMLLFQVGGLGIMVLSTFATVILGGRLTLRGERALEHVLDLGSPAHAYRLVRFIVLATLGIEAAGAFVLWLCYLRHGLGVGEALWRGVFQSISAFCNAGFSLQTDSIVMFQSDPVALFVHGALIVLGGLGFVVLAAIWARVVRRSHARALVQVRVVLWLSGLLIVVGTVLYAALEWQHTLAGMSTFDKLANALFQSVTTRTAGFNSVDYAAMRPATVLVIIVFMFIGAAPGGTGGGIKVTTVAVLAAAIPDIVGTRHGATIFGRTIPPATLQRAATITVVAALTMVVALFLLLVTEDAPFMLLAFETVSALGTVGLSLGVTGALTAAGKWTIIVTMFIGRIGPLTLALALGQRARPHVRYPETRIMVG
jgi:trk system potassium uptake protein TrkH